MGRLKRALTVARAMTAKQRRRAEKKQKRAGRLAHVRADWEYTGLILLRCESCGCEQTSGIDGARPCLICGGDYAACVRTLESEVAPVDVPWLESPRPDAPFVLVP